MELVIEAKDDNAELFKDEAADLLFHYLILLQAKFFLQAKVFLMNDVIEVLKKRHSNTQIP